MKQLKDDNKLRTINRKDNNDIDVFYGLKKVATLIREPKNDGYCICLLIEKKDYEPITTKSIMSAFFSIKKILCELGFEPKI
jgi:hypothetical protein